MHQAEPSRFVSGIGTSLRIDASSAAAGERFQAIWQRCLDDGAAQAATGRDLPDAISIGPDSELTSITQAITKALINAQAGKLLLFHAGAVCHPETGRSLVFVAPGGTGKTTLARTLGTRYGYLTDETVAIDRELRILPYPKPLSIRTQPGTAKTEHSPDELGLLPAHADPKLARLVILERDDTHGQHPSVTEMGLLDAIVELAPQTSSLHLLPNGLQRIAELVAVTGAILKVRYTEATALAPLVDEWIGGKP